MRFMDETALIYLRVMCSFSFTVKSASSADSCFLDLCSCKTKYDSLNYFHGNVKVTFFTLHLISKQLAGFVQIVLFLSVIAVAFMEKFYVPFAMG